MADDDSSTVAEQGGDFPPSVPFNEIASGLTGHDYQESEPDNRLPGDPKPEPAKATQRETPPEEAERHAPTAERSAQATKPAEETVTVQGHTYTLSQLQSEIASNPDLARTLATGHNQYQDVRTRLEEERKRRLEEYDRREAENRRQAEAPRIDPLQRKREIVAMYGPKIQNAVEREGFNADLAQDYPDHAAELLYYRDVIFGMGAAVLALQQQMDQGSVGSAQKEYQAAHDRALDTLADSDEFFGALRTDPNHRAAFKAYIGRLDPDAQMALDPKELEGMYFGFSRQPVLEAVKAGTREVRQREGDATRRARGAARSTRAGGRPGSQPQTPDESNFSALINLGLGAGR